MGETVTRIRRVSDRVYGGLIQGVDRVSPAAARILVRSIHRCAVTARAGLRVVSRALEKRKAVRRVKEGTFRLPAVDGRPVISVVIPVRNEVRFTIACLDALAVAARNTPFEVILVDDQSTDQTPVLMKGVANLRILTNTTNLGFLKSANLGAAAARGEYVVLLHNDTVPAPGSLDALVETFRGRPDAGLVGAKLVSPGGRLQEAGGIVWADGTASHYGYGDDPEKPQYNYTKECDYVSGAAVMLPARLWQSLGGSCEGRDLACRVREAGCKVYYQPKAVVVHHGGAAHGRNAPTGPDVYWARDRSRGRKSILVVDYQVPLFDKECGGRAMFQYLKLFVEAGLNVKFLPGDLYRTEPYSSALGEMGVEVLYGPWNGIRAERWVKDHGRYLDYVLLSRPEVAEPYLPIFRRLTRAKVLYYGIDLYHVREMRQYEISKDPKDLASSRKWREREFSVIEAVDVACYFSRFEVDLLRRDLPGAEVQVVPLYIYEGAPPGERPPFGQRRGLLFVGGFRHPPNPDAVHWFVKEVLPRIRMRLSDVELYVIGSSPPPEILALKSEGVHVTGYVSDEELQRYYDLCRVAVVPLRYGAGIKGKLVEALHQSLPVVTTTVGAEGLPGVEDALLLGNAAEEFADHVCELYASESLWNAYAQKGRAYVHEHFSPDAARRALAPYVELPSPSAEQFRPPLAAVATAEESS